ncbi:MAG: hydroxymethylglutaryl-CoA synthase, partial [Thermoleophilaceae bacterium]|nr:hydroxymethylglutaryl-CoA synthase [Thermoleophilaceae bacterium]
MMSRGIVTYAGYLPRHRLQRSELAAAHGGRGTGARVVASHDEDSTTLAVEAARKLIGSAAEPPGSIHFATTSPPYLDKANATAIHAALDLGHEGFAVDMAGSARSAIGALRAAASGGGLAVMADVRTGLPASADEREGADGGAAFLFGPADQSAVEILAEASVTVEFLDRWRIPSEPASRQWEERFGLETYLPLAREVAGRVLEEAGIEQPDTVVVSSPHARAAAALGKEFAAESLELGYAGAADVGLRLAAALDGAQPGETILLLSAADGADAALLRTTDRIADARRGAPIAAQLAGGRDVAYPRYLSWRGLLDTEPPRRPEPDRPAGPPSARAEAWKFAFVGSACDACGQVHVPPRRVCAGCGAVDQMTRRPLADQAGTVATYT